MYKSVNVSISNLLDPLADNSWVRLEQIQDEKQATIGEVAELVDDIFGITPCKGEYDTGVVVEEEPTTEEIEENFTEAVSANFSIQSCDSFYDGSWIANVAIWKSDPGADHIVKVIGGKQTGDIVDITVDVSETIDVSGSSYVLLDKPIIGAGSFTWLGNAVDSSGNSVRPTINVVGNVLYWSGTVTGVISARYGSKYTLITIIVHPGEVVDDEITQGECTVWCFAIGTSDSLELDAPTVSDIDKDTYCGEAASVDIEGVPKVPQWVTTVTEFFCECSNDISHRTTSPPPTAADMASYSFPGITETVNGGFVNCNEIDASISDPEFYIEKCCDPPSFSLPVCRKKYTRNVGGNSMSSEDEIYYTNKFYPKPVTFIPVAPEDGSCGDTITTYKLNALACCDFVPALVYENDESISVINDNTYGVISVSGGRLPLIVSVKGNGFYLDSSRTIKHGTSHSNSFFIYTGDSCGAGDITISDGCSTASGRVLSTDGQYVETYRNNNAGINGYADPDTGEVINEPYNGGECPAYMFSTVLTGTNTLSKDGYEITHNYSEVCSTTGSFSTAAAAVGYCAAQTCPEGGEYRVTPGVGCFYEEAIPGRPYPCKECGECSATYPDPSPDFRSADIGKHSFIYHASPWYQSNVRFEQVIFTIVSEWRC